ncbi:MAG TPA: PadR family transcriptional regulator [Ktedonobacteraceae bacterium]
MYIDILILSHLIREPAHGYEIKKRVEGTFRGMIPLNNKLLYPALRRFEEQGAVVSEVVHTQGRPDRSVYSLTSHGEELLRELLRNYPLELALDDAEFLVRVAFFQFLDVPDRLRILQTRETVMRDHLRYMTEGLETELEPEQQGGKQVIAFLRQQVEHELVWITALMREQGDR